MHETVCFEWAQHAYVHRFIFSWIKHEFIAIDCVKLHFSSFLSNLNTGFRNSHFFTPWRWSKTRFQKDKKMEWNTSFTYIFRTHSEHVFFFPYFFVKYWTCFVQSLAPVLTVSLSVSQIGCGLSVRELWVPGSCTTFFSRLPHILKPSNCDQLPITCRKSFLCGIQRRSGRCASWYWIPLHFIFEIHSNIH